MEGAEEEEFVLLGDLSVDFLKPASPSFRHLHQALLLPLNLFNLITTATTFYKGGCTSLDVVLSNSESLNSGLVADTDVSDHCLVMGTYNLTSPLAGYTDTSACRGMATSDLRHLDVSLLERLLKNAGLTQFELSDVEGMWNK